ncbi:MAG: hypothetical protein DCC55_36635 [Chloroflexi bacterium]|nr:MAG: hypothetical protein DCC55_36635 [Chloroflexota bacterium]
MIILIVVLMTCFVGFPTVSQAGLFDQLKEEGKKIQGAIDSIDSVLKSGQGQQRGVPPAPAPSPQSGHRPSPPPFTPTTTTGPSNSESPVAHARTALGGYIVSPKANMVLSKGEILAMQQGLDSIELGMRPSIFDERSLCFARSLPKDEKGQFVDRDEAWHGKDAAEKKSTEQRFVNEYRSRVMANAIMPPQRLAIVFPMYLPPYSFQEQRFTMAFLQFSGPDGALRADRKTNQIHVDLRGFCSGIRLSIPFPIHRERSATDSVLWDLSPSEAEGVRQQVSKDQVYVGILVELGNASAAVPIGTNGGQAQATFVDFRSMPVPDAPVSSLSVISKGFYANPDLERLLKDLNSLDPSGTPALAQAESRRNESASKPPSEAPAGPPKMDAAKAYRSLAGCLAARYLTEEESTKYIARGIWSTIAEWKRHRDYTGNMWSSVADTARFWKGSTEFEAARSKDAFLADYAGRFGDPELESKRCAYGESWSPDQAGK